MARLHDSSLTFLYVLEDPTIEVYGRSYGADLRKDLLKAGDETLDEAFRRAQVSNVPAKTVLVEGKHPADAILELEKEHDLTILGTHGRKGMNRMVLGSVTEEVMRNSKGPHLVVACH